MQKWHQIYIWNYEEMRFKKSEILKSKKNAKMVKKCDNWAIREKNATKSMLKKKKQKCA